MTVDITSRLVNAFVSNANLHIGWHWDPAALARGTSMMPFSSRLALGLVRISEYLQQLSATEWAEKFRDLVGKAV